MTDKLRKTIPIKVTFGQGEQPTSNKLNVLSQQSRQSLDIVEKALGDLWNQSGDGTLNDYPLQIANLARTIGQQKDMNLPFYPPTEQFYFIDEIGVRWEGNNESDTLFKPINIGSVTASGTNLVKKHTNISGVQYDGDWYIDADEGILYSYSELDYTDQLQYTVDPTDWVINDATLPSVIPDPRQSSF